MNEDIKIPKGIETREEINKEYQKEVNSVLEAYVISLSARVDRLERENLRLSDYIEDLSSDIRYLMRKVQ